MGVLGSETFSSQKETRLPFIGMRVCPFTRLLFAGARSLLRRRSYEGCQPPRGLRLFVLVAGRDREPLATKELICSPGGEGQTAWIYEVLMGMPGAWRTSSGWEAAHDGSGFSRRRVQGG